MSALALVLLYTTLAGLMIPLGGALANREHLHRGHIREDLLHGIVAFGGGVLLATVALVLVPEGLTQTPIPEFSVLLLAGAVLFLLLDRATEVRGGRGGQMLAMVMDYVPESVALGAAFGLGGNLGPLLALLIALQNLPEGFNSYRQLREAGSPVRRALLVLATLVSLGPLAGVLGFTLLASDPRAVAWIFLVAAGGILYGVFQDIAPLAHRRGHWVPTLGAVLGFLVGAVSESLVMGLG